LQSTEAMTDLNSVSNEVLLVNIKKLSENERRITYEILLHLAEIERRRAYAKLGYPNLWEYTLKELKYSASAAYRRISAMRALNNNPELGEKIQNGALSISTVSQVQTFLRAERDQANKIYTKNQKSELFKKCENKSSREVTKELLTISPVAAIRVQKEREITENRTIISFVAEPNLLTKIYRVRDLSAARLRNPASYPELIDLMSEVTLDEIDPLRKPIRQTKPDKMLAPITSQPTSSVRHIPTSLRIKIWQKYEGRCAFVDAQTRKRCNSTFGLEIEHCKPHALGGSSTDEDNLRLLCKHHNQWQAIQTYGLDKMEPYLKSKDHCES